MKITEIVRKLMAETIGEEVGLKDDEVGVREFQNLLPWFDNYGVVISLSNPKWVSKHGFWAESYIAFEDGDNVLYGIKAMLPTEEDRNIIVTGGKVEKDNRDMVLYLKETDQRLVILFYLFEKIRDKPKEEMDLFLRYAKAVPSIGVVGMLRFEPIYSKMPKDDQKRFLKTLRTESRNMPHLRESINILDKSDVDVSYG